MSSRLNFDTILHAVKWLYNILYIFACLYSPRAGVCPFKGLGAHVKISEISVSGLNHFFLFFSF